MSATADGLAGPLSQIRVVEIAGLPAAAYAARLLADFGAEVIKVEPPDGDPQRHIAPLLNAGDGSAVAAWFAYLNYGKKSVTLDAGTAIGHQQLAALIEDADIVIHDDPAHGNAGHATALAGEAQIVARVGWFGPGPYRDMVCTDSVCRALAGASFLTGPHEGPPLALPDFQAGILGGLATAIPLLAALWEAQGRGGRRIDISVHEACVAIAEYQAVEGRAGIIPRHRWGLNRYAPTYPLGIYPCKQGWIGVTIVTPAQWRSFCELLGVPQLGRDPGWAMGSDRLPRADELEARILPVFRTRTAAEWFDLAIQHRLPFAIVPSLGELLESPEFHRRRSIVPIELAGRSLQAPGSPLHLTATPPRHGAAVPAAGRDNEILTAPRRDPRRATRQAPADASKAGGSLPLAGMRIIDLSMGWAGPTVTRHLADLGADIIKVEACGYPDWWRGTDTRPGLVEERRYEKTLRFNIMNRNKRAITLDLTTPRGAELLKQLVRRADGVVENYSADVLAKFGLDYAQLCQVNPAIVMMSMNAYGSTGPWRDSRAYGSTLEQGSGLPSAAGRPGDPPIKSHLAYGDPVGGLNGAAAMLVALLHRQRSGRGQFIDLSQVQCMMPFAAVFALQQSADGVPPAKTGNRHPALVPHGMFRCAGEDAWVQIAVTDQAMWRGLCSAIGRSDLAADPALDTVAGRRAAEDRLEVAISAWSAGQSPDAAMQTLQRHGVAAGVVRLPADLFDDPQLLARGYWRQIDRPFIGLHPQPAAPYRFGPDALPVRFAAGTLGQFNAEVLGELLGITAQTLAELEAAGIIGSVAVPPEQRKSRAAAA